MKNKTKINLMINIIQKMRWKSLNIYVNKMLIYHKNLNPKKAKKN